MEAIWYHGSPLRLTVLLKGSTITQDRHLAEVFSHKPEIVSVDDEGAIKHNGTQSGYLYRIAERVGTEDVRPHHTSSMAPGKEWLTGRELRLELIGPTVPQDEEQVSKEELAVLQRLLHKHVGG